jgi:hypothetical protein
MFKILLNKMFAFTATFSTSGAEIRVTEIPQTLKIWPFYSI